MKETHTKIEVELQRSEMEVDYRLRVIAANLIRLARGGGKAYELEAQINQAQLAFERYRELATHGVPPHVIDRALASPNAPRRKQFKL
ncbi:hypothetical protein RA28_12900 [Ruegeria sp. ANG-S4]|nr:hypothetical protein RA28_12900 [Ruegeria sp. ANG-S4]